MAKLSIVVVDPPKHFDGYGEIQLVLSTKEGEFAPNLVGAPNSDMMWKSTFDPTEAVTCKVGDRR